MAVKQIRTGRNKGRYIIDWRDEYGVRRYEMQGYNYRAAHDALHKKITDRAEEKTLDKKEISEIRFHPLCDEYLEKYAKVRKYSWQTDELRIRHFKRYFGNPPIASMKRADVNAYALKRKAEDVQGGTVNKEIAILRRIFWYAVDNDWLEYNPAQRWQEFPENPSDDSFLEWGQYQELLAATQRVLERPGNGSRRRLHVEQFKFMIPLAYETGGRHEEIVGLKWDDIDVPNKRVRYWYRKGKNHEVKYRWVPMSDHCARILSQWPKAMDCPYLFPDETGGYWKSKIAFYRQWDNITKEAGMEGLHFHRLRHSYCSQLANQGLEESTRMRLMGHTSPITQQRYTHISEQRKREAAEIFNRFQNAGTGDSKAIGGQIRQSAEKVENRNTSNLQNDLNKLAGEN